MEIDWIVITRCKYEMTANTHLLSTSVICGETSAKARFGHFFSLLFMNVKSIQNNATEKTRIFCSVVISVIITCGTDVQYMSKYIFKMIIIIIYQYRPILVVDQYCVKKCHHLCKVGPYSFTHKYVCWAPVLI